MPIGLKSIQLRPAGLVVMTAYFLCFGPGIIELVKAWWLFPDSQHGLLIAPLAIWMAYRKGVLPESARIPMKTIGLTLIIGSAFLHVIGRAGGIATAPRLAIIGSLVGIILWFFGWRQLVKWSLPFVLILLTIPIPESIIGAITIPLQGLAAQLGAFLLTLRGIPVLVTGNIISLPGHVLFVSEACSGLRSLTAIVSMAVLVASMFLRHWSTRVTLVFSAIFLAIIINGFRVFLTGFLVYFVDPKLGDGFMHLTEGYLLFLFSLLILGALAWIGGKLEARFLQGSPIKSDTLREVSYER